LDLIKQNKKFKIDDILDFVSFKSNFVYIGNNDIFSKIDKLKYQELELIFNKTSVSPYFLNIDLDLEEKEIEAIIKLAKKRIKKQKQDTLFNILVKQLNSSKKRDRTIPLEDKICDLIYLLDCKILEFEKNTVINQIYNYHIKKETMVSPYYITGTYYQRLEEILNNILKSFEIFKKIINEKNVN